MWTTQFQTHCIQENVNVKETGGDEMDTSRKPPATSVTQGELEIDFSLSTALAGRPASKSQLMIAHVSKISQRAVPTTYLTKNSLRFFFTLLH